MVLRKYKYDIINSNLVVIWATSEDPGGYNKSIHAKDSLFDQSKGEKKYTRKVIEYEKFLGIKESNQILIIQAIKNPYLEALKEDYIGHGGEMTNKDKVQLKKEVFIMWEQPQVLFACFKQIKKARKQLAK